MIDHTNEIKKPTVETDTVRRVARLARINVSNQQCDTLAAELSTIIGFVHQLNQVDTEGVPPMTGVAQTLPMRADEVTDGNKQGDVLRNAPERLDTFFTVPKVIE